MLTDEEGNELITSMDQCIEIDNSEILLGDFNGDGVVNVVDVVMIVGAILNGGDYNIAADMNGDGVINVVDVVMIVGVILNI